MPKVQLTGIVNVTPDSFSDGGRFLDCRTAHRRAFDLLADGAHRIEVGGDSTRPGSTCVGMEEEWRRIGKLVQELARDMPLVIDTHHAETAGRALDCGARIINDITAGADPDMFSVIGRHRAGVVLMHSCCPAAHQFAAAGATDIVQQATSFLLERRQQALQAGVLIGQIVLDPGMGAFIGPQPDTSIELARRFGELESLHSTLMLGVSRKGFLKRPGEASIEERDRASAALAYEVCTQLGPEQELHVRVHNIRIHREVLFEFLSVW